MRRLVAVLTVAALALPGSLLAQERAETSIDAAKLGVSLDRIRRELRNRESTETVTSNGRKLNIRVEVFGQAPPLDFFTDKEFSLTLGPVPNSAPTHREHIDFVTPQAFKAPVMPIFGLAVWAAQKLAERSKKSKCEEEIEIYRNTLMQGIPVTAPRCAQ